MTLDYHRVLLADATRALAYREALRRVVKPDDVVLDLGSGTGILALFAKELGARRVFAIERSPMAGAIALLACHSEQREESPESGDSSPSSRLGMTRARLGMTRGRLGMTRVEVIQGESAKVELPERATLLVTEILGNFGLQEQILSSVIDARARLLAPGATIIPRGVALWAVPAELPREHEQYVGFWSGERYGVDLTPLRTFAANALFNATIESDAYLAEPAEILGVDLASIADSTVGGDASFEVARDGTLHGFAGWFHATLADGIALSNREARATHWKQTFLPIEHPVAVTRGMRVSLALQSHDGKAWRWRGRAGETDFDQTTYLALPPHL